jgi:hypothetical protein
MLGLRGRVLRFWSFCLNIALKHSVHPTFVLSEAVCSGIACTRCKLAAYAICKYGVGWLHMLRCCSVTASHPRATAVASFCVLCLQTAPVLGCQMSAGQQPIRLSACSMGRPCLFHRCSSLFLVGEPTHRDAPFVCSCSACMLMCFVHKVCGQSDP